MIKSHLSRIMGERKLRISDIINMTGLARNTVADLYWEKERKVKSMLHTLDRLCETLDVSVGDLLEYVNPIGLFRTMNGELYDCYFHPEQQYAEAIGPLGPADRGKEAGTRGTKVTVQALSKEEARQKIAEGLGNGSWIEEDKEKSPTDS